MDYLMMLLKWLLAVSLYAVERRICFKELSPQVGSEFRSDHQNGSSDQ